MRISDVAALAGVSTRTVRHYHHVGILPEPKRSANGYRDYGLRDAIVLVRARRLVALGMSLDEVADLLSDESDRDLAEILSELEADLARQENEISAMRERIAAALAQTEDGMALVGSSPAVSALLTRLESTGLDSDSARLDAEILSLLPDETAQSLFSHLLGDGGAVDSAAALAPLYEEFDALATARDDDPRIDALAMRIGDLFDGELRARIGQESLGDASDAFAAMLAEHLQPAQVAVMQRVLTLLREA